MGKYDYYWEGTDMDIEILVGKTLTKVEQAENDEALIFHTDDGERYMMYHSQDCCECVRIEDICGNLEDLVGSPILTARENTSHGEDPEDMEREDGEEDWRESFTWTFYDLATEKGAVTIRWYGESNGYYSESVDFVKMGEGEDN